MRLFTKSLCVALILTMLFSVLPFEASCQEIRKDVFRLHILANSDTDKDQNLKLKVRDAVLEYTENLYKNSNTKEEAEILTSKNLQNIANVAKQVIVDNGYNYNVTCQIEDVYFNTRTYENVTMPSGTYRALQIKIGNAKGKNWWCVMYPSLCVGASTDYKALDDKLNDKEYDTLVNEKTQYKFKIVEIYERIVSFFLCCTDYNPVQMI